MDKAKSKSIIESKHKNGDSFKKKGRPERHSKTDTSSTSSVSSDPGGENFIVVGKKCSTIKSRSFESGHKLHGCHSDTTLCTVPDLENAETQVPLRQHGVQSTCSYSSFVSAKSDWEVDEQKKITESESKGSPSLKHHILEEEKYTEVSRVLTETEEVINNFDDFLSKLKNLEKKISFKEKKIKDLNNKLEEVSKAKDFQVEKNKGLTHQINVLNRQLQSMYDLMAQKNWSNIDPSELAKYKTKAAELEAILDNSELEKKELLKKVDNLLSNLDSKDKEISCKSKELVEYKNRSTLEMCKLLNQIDLLQKEMKSQSQILDLKIIEVQNTIDDEIVNVTQKLEEQYQKDVKAAIEKLQADFNHLADLPKNAIDKLLQLSEPNKIDVIAFQKEWEKQQTSLEKKITSMQSDHHKEILQLKDSYESKIIFLKTQVESLSSQLKERKKLLDVFESELMSYKSNSSMNLLRASPKEGDISAIKELYTAEIFSQKQVHKLQIDIFEDKVKTLTEEILYHSKNEEIYLKELDSARKMAQTFRLKYEKLVSEWEERVEKNFKIVDTPEPDLNNLFDELKALISSLKQVERSNEERITKLQVNHDSELNSYIKEIEMFKSKLFNLEQCQKAQSKLDSTIESLIGDLSINYSKSVEALLTSHAAELNLKQTEMYMIEKRYSDELSAVKSKHEKEITTLKEKVKILENVEKEKSSETELTTCSDDVSALKLKIEEITSNLIKCEGMLASKEETEKALNERIQELEQLLKQKEEKCKKELENIVAKYLEAKIMFSAREDLLKELEESLNLSEDLLEKSCDKVGKLVNILSTQSKTDLEEKHESEEERMKQMVNYAKINGENLKEKLIETFENIDLLENQIRVYEDCEKNKSTVKEIEMKEKIENLENNLKSVKETQTVLEKEKNELLNININLSETLLQKDKIIEKIKAERKELLNASTKLEDLEKEKKELLLREELVTLERNEILERNEMLEENIRDLHDRMDHLISELATKKGPRGDGVFSISLQQVRVLYEENVQFKDINVPSTASISCHSNWQSSDSDVKFDKQLFNDLKKVNENLKKENENLLTELKERDAEQEIEEVENSKNIHKEIFSKFKKIQNELSDVLSEKNTLLAVNENLKSEKEILKKEIEYLKDENRVKKSSEGKMKVAFEKSRNSGEESVVPDSRIGEMKKEIGKLSDYIKSLSNKIDMIKESNECLLNKSNEHLKQNQDLVCELEEAWSQRYEIEDQLARVRKENALLNLHRTQLEDTNKRISNLLADGKPSVVSWIKIHETVENIVDEVLALKTSFSSASMSGASIGQDVPKSTSELKVMAENLHTQLQNKTLLCDELVVQKESLERELLGLEDLLKSSDSKSRNTKIYESQREIGLKKNNSEVRHTHSVEKRQIMKWKDDHQVAESSNNTHMATLNILKKHLQSQIELEEAHFRENLEFEIKGLKKEMQRLEESIKEKKSCFHQMGSGDGADLAAIEVQYEEEVLGLNKEFEREVESLKKRFAKEKTHDDVDEEVKQKYLDEIKKIKLYFEEKWLDLEKRYQSILHKQRKESSETDASNSNQTFEEIQQFFGIEVNENTNLRTLLREILKKHKEELSIIKSSYENSLCQIEESHTTEVQKLKLVVSSLKDNIMAELNRGEKEKRVEEMEKEYKGALEEMKREYEGKLENEKKMFEDELEEMKRKYEKEKSDFEEFWTEKLSECETKCAILKATGENKTDTRNQSSEKTEKTLERTQQENQNVSTLSSTQVDYDQSGSDLAILSSSFPINMDLSRIIQEINENSLLNTSSDQVRMELDRCLKQLKKDANTILALSNPQTSTQNLSELVKNLEKEKNILESKVSKVEEMQDEIKKEINLTKDKLVQWERNLEIVTEGYGEEVVEPKKVIPLSEIKEKIKLFLADQPQQMNLLDEIFKEGDHLQEEWIREKRDLQQQIEVADKQLHSMKKFLEEQATEREQEREAFDKEIIQLKENLKSKERNNAHQDRINREGENESMDFDSVEALESQLKELTVKLGETEKNKCAVESEFQNAVKKIWSLREVIQDLEIQIAESCEKEMNLKKKVEKLENVIEEQNKVTHDLKDELDLIKNQNELKFSEHLNDLEEELIRLRKIADQINPETFSQLKSNLREIERIIIRKTRDLEQMHVPSTNASCSSPSEDVSLRDQFEATRCSTPDEMACNAEQNIFIPLEEVDRIYEELARHSRAEEVAMKCIKDLKMQLKNNKKGFDEIQTERDVLLEKVDLYLKENCSLKTRLEEQRCNAGLLQKQLNANLESQINRLEVDVEKLNELCFEKDKQLRDIKEVLENTTKTLQMREAEVLNKSKEENSLISNLKTDLENALSENEKLEKKLEKVKEKLKESMKMPALIDSMIDEKNAEIDRLEKEVARLVNENTSLLASKSSVNVAKRIKFSEPDSFSEYISSISGPNPSTIRNSSETYPDIKYSPFKFPQSSTKVEFASSIGALQLSPRGTDPSLIWKTSSPIVPSQDTNKSTVTKSPSNKSETDYQKMNEESKLNSELKSKQREISELHLEIDILKRQLAEQNQELATTKTQLKEMENDLIVKTDEIRKIQNNENSLLMTIKSLKKNHCEELEDMENKLSFECQKVEKVYEEIKALEVKKIEIEESFLSLKEEYNERLKKEQKTVETLIEQMKELEGKNNRLMSLKSELEEESLEKTKKFEKEVSNLKEENERLRSRCENLSKMLEKEKADVEVQVDEEYQPCDICRKNVVLILPEVEGSVSHVVEDLKSKFEKMAEVLTEKDFSKTEAFTYAMSVKKLLTTLLKSFNDVYEESESLRKKVMESSVDDLAIKVQRELLLSAKLDNKLLSSIEANGLAQEPNPLEKSYKEVGGGDTIYLTPNINTSNGNLSKEILKLQNEKETLKMKLVEKLNMIKKLEENLLEEKEKMVEEKERCNNDAKIMELLRVNLEKALAEIKAKDKELKKEKIQQITLEKDIQTLKKRLSNASESKKVADLYRQIECQKEKIVSIGRALEEEKKKSQELKILLEQSSVDRMADKNAIRLIENDLEIVREQKENLKMELIKARKLVNSRNVEIGLLKRKINLQEIDIKALTLSNDYTRQSSSEVSSITSNHQSVDEITLNRFSQDLSMLPDEIPSSLLDNMKKLNTCVQRHVKESTEMGEALLCLSQETEQMREMIRKLEESNESKVTDETLVADLEMERRLWALEKGGLVMDIETLRRELEVLKRNWLETTKSNEILKAENLKLKKDLSSPREYTNQIELGILQDRISHLTHKYLRAESYRKALAWQKVYLMITIGEHKRSEEEAWKKIGGRRKEKRNSASKRKRFRIVALVVLATFRIRFIVRRWHKVSIAQNQIPPRLLQRKTNTPSLASVFNLYNEPVNPLSYQTQNIIRSPSNILRTPPSRDPGVQGFSLDVKKISYSLEAKYLKENLGATNM